MSRLQALHTDCDQSPWLDNLGREWLASGELAGWIGRGARGLTANPSISAAAMTQSDAYDEDLAAPGSRRYRPHRHSLLRSQHNSCSQLWGPLVRLRCSMTWAGSSA